jgi:Kef-type K+ transport system membrane component KefB
VTRRRAGFLCALLRQRKGHLAVEKIWFQSALWMALALIAAFGSMFITISAAPFEIVIGAVAGNTVGLPLTPWIDYIAGFGAIVLTFLAGTDIDPHVVKRNFGSSVTIGLMGALRPISAACFWLTTGLVGRGRKRRSPESRYPPRLWPSFMRIAMKMVTKFVGILPLTRYFNFEKREGMYTTLMMSTGLTFGSISALFGLTNHIIDQDQYTILLTAVIGSAVVPTLIAQIWFHPHFEPLEEDA